MVHVRDRAAPRRALACHGAIGPSAPKLKRMLRASLATHRIPPGNSAYSNCPPSPKYQRLICPLPFTLTRKQRRGGDAAAADDGAVAAEERVTGVGRMRSVSGSLPATTASTPKN